MNLLKTIPTLVVVDLGLTISFGQDCSLSLLKGLPLGKWVDVGYSTVLSVEIAGTPPITYQWYRDDVAIEGATNVCYQTRPFGGDYPGQRYYVVVKNPCAILQSSLVTVMWPQDPVFPCLIGGMALASNQVVFQSSCVPRRRKQLRIHPSINRDGNENQFIGSISDRTDSCCGKLNEGRPHLPACREWNF